MRYSPLRFSGEVVMNSEKTSPRYPWVALVLSFLASGVGHIYCGRIARGFVLYSTRLLLPLLCVIAAFARPSYGVFFGLLLLPAAATLLIFFYSAMDAYVIAQRAAPDYELKRYNTARLYWFLVTGQMAFLIALTWVGRECLFEGFYIPTRSMCPNILAGDRILVNKRLLRDGYPQRGDVVVFRTSPPLPPRNWVQRVIGVAGDQIWIKGHDIVVNGHKLERARAPTENISQQQRQVEGDIYYESHAGRRYRVLLADDANISDIDEINITVPDASIFVMGDNRDGSRDSRHIGSIQVDSVIGSVDYVYYPAETWSRIGWFRDR
jgi:signal peptidase I